MSAVKVGDTVRVARQPLNQWIKICGEVGEVDEIDEASGDVSIRTFDLAGQHVSGLGTVPVGCLEPYSDPRLDATIARHRAELAAVRADMESRRVRWNALVDGVAKKHGITHAAAEEILQAGSDFD